MNRKIAFGTYRVNDTELLHIEALKLAIESGVELIDTATNYYDGGSERAVAIALNGIDEERAKSLKIVSKAGYLQGSLLQEYKERKSWSEVVEYAPHVYHCIHPDFITEQLERSLSRLHVKRIDAYLLHNPEYYLLDAINRGVAKEEALDVLHERIYQAFVALENAVQSGKIDGYGVSSNSFGVAKNRPEFLPYEDMLALAHKASETVGANTHHFTTIELPINLLEQEGLACAKWAKRNGLRVLANRPLNAMRDNLMYRLAEYEEPREYFHRLNELLELLEGEDVLYNLVEQMDMTKHRFGFIGEYDSFFHQEILPHLQNALAAFDETKRQTLSEQLELFLHAYRAMVAYESSKLTKTALKEEFRDCKEKMQHCALRFVLEHEEIDFVLTGMRRPSYVTDVLDLE